MKGWRWPEDEMWALGKKNRIQPRGGRPEEAKPRVQLLTVLPQGFAFRQDEVKCLSQCLAPRKMFFPFLAFPL